MRAAPTTDLRLVRPREDARLLHDWVTHPRSRYWEMGDLTVAGVEEAYAEIAACPRHDAWLGSVDSAPTFLCEVYDPATSPLAGLVGLPDLREGDVGMHVLVAPPAGDPVPGLTRRVFATVMRHCFDRYDAARVVVEPHVGNTAIAALNAEAGFVVARVVDLATKPAALSFCTPEAFLASPIGALP